MTRLANIATKPSIHLQRDLWIKSNKFMPPNRKKKFLLISAIAVICTLRFAFFYDAYLDNPNLIVDPDTKSYLDISKNFYETGQYERIPGKPEIHRPPGYPLYLALNYALFGQDNLLAPVILHHVLFFFMMLMVARLARQVGGTAAMMMATGLYAFDFTTFYYVNEILSELLFTFFILLAITLFNSAVLSINRQKSWFFLMGLMLTVAIFVRPVGLYLVYPITIYIAVIAYFDSEKTSHSAKSAVIFFVPWLVLGGAWYLYSFSVSGNFTFTSYETEGVFDQRLVAVLKSSLGIDHDTAYTMVRERLLSADSQTRAFFVLLCEHPWAAFKETITDMGRQLLSPSQWYLKFYFPTVFENQVPMEKFIFTGNFAELASQLEKRPAPYFPIVLFVFVHLVVVYLGVLLSVFGIRRLSFENLALYMVMILFIGYFVGITIGFIGHSRFRVPFMPALVILSGYGFSLLFSRNKSKMDWE